MKLHSDLTAIFAVLLFVTATNFPVFEQQNYIESGSPLSFPILSSTDTLSPAATVLQADTCATCRGAGKIMCWACSGKGGIWTSRDEKSEKKWAECSFCHGTKQLVCTCCKGSGKK